MNKNEFLEQLNQMLSDLPEEERTEAVSYYEEYLAEAGPEQEARILEEFGTPEQVAGGIRENLYGSAEQGGVYTETGYHTSTEAGRQTPGQFTQLVPGTENEKAGWKETEQNQQYGSQTGEGGQQEDSQRYEQHGANPNAGTKKGMSGEMKALLIALLVLFAVPIGAVAIGVFAVILGVMASIFGVAVSFLAMTLAFLVTGVVLVAVGIANLFSTTPAGVLLCGLGFLFFGAGMLCMIATVFIFGTALPWLCREIGKGCKHLFHRRKEQTV